MSLDGFWGWRMTRMRTDDGVDGGLELSPDEEGDGCRRKTSPMIPAFVSDRV